MTLSKERSQIDFIYDALVLTGSIFALETMSQPHPPPLCKMVQSTCSSLQSAGFHGQRAEVETEGCLRSRGVKKRKDTQKGKKRRPSSLTGKPGLLVGPWMEVSGTSLSSPNLVHIQ